MKITYREENGCLTPNRELSKKSVYPIWKNDRMRPGLFKRHRRGSYTSLWRMYTLSRPKGKSANRQ